MKLSTRLALLALLISSCSVPPAPIAPRAAPTPEPDASPTVIAAPTSDADELDAPGVPSWAELPTSAPSDGDELQGQCEVSAHTALSIDATCGGPSGANS